MDIRTSGGPPTAEEVLAVDSILGPAPAPDRRLGLGGQASRARRHLLLPVLHALQDRVGWISRGGLDEACRRLEVAPAEAYGVASFYALLATEERPPLAVHICDDLVCGPSLAAAIEERLGPPGRTWHRSSCLGHCDRRPAAFLQLAGDQPQELSLAPAAAEQVAGIVNGSAWPVVAPGIPEPGRPEFEVLRQAREIGAVGVIARLEDSGLAGRGGAGFPTGRKWAAVAGAAALPHYVVCNADESEPGSFKDRILIERDPLALVEAIAVAALATGSEKAYVYIRGEYPLARALLAAAIDSCSRTGALGELQIEIRRGAGAYICGEETALFNSIEGYRGEPRNKPPFPAQAGLFGKPTLVNNVETLLAARDVVAGRPALTRIFCVSGAVARPGAQEVLPGTPLRRVLEAAGAEPDRLRAVLLGGAAGTFLGPADLDVQLTSEAVRAIGATLGSGVVFAVGEQSDLRPILLRIARFFREESCGQCVPCRVGTVRQEEILGRLLNGSGEADRELLSDVAGAMRDASICGLGQTASGAIQSGLIRIGARP